MTTEAPPEPVLSTPEFPFAFADPSHAELTWEWDDMHMPHPLAPLAGDYACALAHAFQEPYRKYNDTEFGPFPQEWFSACWNGYVYYAFRRNIALDQRKALFDRVVALNRWLIPTAEAYWRDELLPELKALYAATDAVPVETGSLDEVARGWEAGWDARRRAWDIHFDIISGPYQVMDDLVDAYDAATPGAAAGEALRLAHGQRHELYDVEVAMEQLRELALATPAIAAALRGGSRSLDDLRALPRGEAFVTAAEAFLTEHGHLGQSVDDLALPSWAEEPAGFLVEVARRLDHPPEPAETRRARLEREAESLANGVRQRLADNPKDLARFEEVLHHARKIGFMTETHNYWIDRKSQAVTRSLAIRIGRRLVAEGLLAEPEDILYLHHDEIGPVLRDRSDQRPLIATRKAEHARQRTMTPPRVVGAPAPPPVAEDRFNGPILESTEAGVLKGTGSSAGIATGPARVVLTSLEFDRIRPGDIVVCPSSNPSWVPVFTIIAGLVTNTGGVLSHAAVVAREFGLPAVTGVAGATTEIRDGQLLEIDGTAGTVRLL